MAPNLKRKDEATGKSRFVKPPAAAKGRGKGAKAAKFVELAKAHFAGVVVGAAAAREAAHGELQRGAWRRGPLESLLPARALTRTATLRALFHAPGAVAAAPAGVDEE